MTIAPFISQFLFPTFLGVYAVIVSLFPHTATLPSKAKTTVTAEKKVLGTTTTPTQSVTISQHTTDNTSDNAQEGNTHKNVTSPQNNKTDNSPTPISTSTTVSPTLSPTQTVSQIITATTILSASGKTIHLAMQYPSLGGNITGTISGDCNGTLSGIYDGPNTQTLSGKGSATCPMGFISVSADISYTGRLISPTLAQIDYTVSALGKKESGSTNLALSH